MQYFFILGRNPELSLAELHAILPYGYKPIACFREVLVVECGGLDVDQLMRRLGGTIKVGEILSRNTYHVTHNTTLGLLQKLPREKKIFLGLSAYALDDKTRLPNVRQLREIGMEMKRELQTPSESSPHPALSLGERGWGEGKKGVRLVTSKDIALSSVIVKKEKLLTQGAEIVLMYGGQASGAPEAWPRYIGKTLAVQEFEEASIRDFGRPERGMKVGMLPIQLAKIMINLARVPICRGQSFGAAPKDCPHAILDPFCGFGTILSEALLMGYRNLIGSDLEQKMVEATRKNLEWLNRIPPTHNSPQPSLNLREGVKLITIPVQELSKHLPPHSVDAIVTEPYMGPTQKISNFEFLISTLVALYISAFREFAKVLKSGGRIVFIMPAFRSGGRITKTSEAVLPKIKNLGFTPTQLLPNTLINQLTNQPINSIIYSRPDQKVLREIFVLKYNALGLS